MKLRTKITVGILALLVVAGLAFVMRIPPTLDHKQYVEKYLADNPNLPAEVRQAILDEKVILGMYPEEAQAAAGQFIYRVKPDPNWPENINPLAVMFAQKQHPDDSRIEMSFNTSTQYGTKERVSFTVRFERGRAVEIKKDD